MLRTIKSVIYANEIDMGGMPVRQGFPSAKAEAVSPFLLLHHADIKVPTHVPPHKAGIGPHPHRGFSPVTLVFKGGVHHRDSRGNNNVVYEGGTQWMNAGMGIIHSERPPHDIAVHGGRQEIIQLWVNTPAAHKMDQPSYFPLTPQQTPTLETNDGLVKIRVHSGQLGVLKSPIPTFTPVNTYSATMQQGGHYEFAIPEAHNAFVYLLHGQIKLNNTDVVDEHYVAILNNDGDGFTIEALTDSVLIVGTGTPIEEPVVSHGPFVLNTQTQVMEAFRDYQMGKMGVLIED